MNVLKLPEVVPQHELLAWRASLKKSQALHCPDEVKEFINAVSIKLPDFAQVGSYRMIISGNELLLCGMKEFEGEKVLKGFVYELPVPRMRAVDHHTAMHRIYHRQGKQGLIRYCRAWVNKTELHKVLEILNVHVFHQEKEEFKSLMNEIRQSQKLETIYG